MALKYVKPTPINLKGHADFTEKWVQDIIRKDPSILGLGDSLEVKDVERIQPKAGRLDLLLRDADTDKRYEVELMLGQVDESHIIRTIEYWDIERRRYPQYDHAAVIVAENITSRFLNVMGLFNSVIPIIALQMNAYQLDDSVILTFTTVLDEVLPGDDDESDAAAETVDAAFWEKKASPKSVKILHDCFSLLQEFAQGLELKYNKHYVGLLENGSLNSFVAFAPKKQFLRVVVIVSNQPQWRDRLDEAGFVLMDGSKKRPKIVFRLSKEELEQHRDLLRELFEAAHAESVS